jgi:acetoin utilization protein AcuB
MSVRDFMTTNVATVTPETKIFDAVDLMKEHDIHRLPVLVNDKIVGLITEGTIQAALPSTATSLSVYEVNFLLNKTTVADVMIKKVTTIAPTALLEDAIYLMRHKDIGVLPVIEHDKLVGIITNNDIFDAFLTITGYNEIGSRVQVTITNDEKGILANIAQILADHDLSIATVTVHRKETATLLEFHLTTADAQGVKKIIEAAGYLVSEAVQTLAKAE